MRVVLASGSPRRRELLASVGVVFETFAPDVDESSRLGEDPVAYVARVALDKLNAVDYPDALVIAADTTVELDGEIVGKPADVADARLMLRRMFGRTHLVHTGVALKFGTRCATATVTSAVTFVPFSEDLLAWYLATGEPLGKAGAYGIQGAAAALVERVDGSVSNVIGLPLHTVVNLAADLGVSLLTGSSAASRAHVR